MEQGEAGIPARSRSGPGHKDVSSGVASPVGYLQSGSPSGPRTPGLCAITERAVRAKSG